MKFIFWMYKGKELASLPLNVVDNERWYRDYYAEDFGIDANQISVVVRYVRI